MHNFKVLTALLITLISVSFKTLAQAPLSGQAGISLLTCGPGEELYSVFGHTAIRVYDPATRFDVVYNFGTFDFDTPNFYGKFIKGDLQYFVSASSYEDFISTYEYYNRDVFEQHLNLTDLQKQNIASDLNTRLTSDKKFYTYKFIHRNCTTIVADIINQYIPTKISLKNNDSGLTYREIIHSRLPNHFFEDLGINLMFGAPTDVTSEKLFLPNELMQGVNNTQTATGPLAKATVTVFKATLLEERFSFDSWWVLSLACLVLLTLTGNVVFQRSFLAITGLLGIFFCCVGFYSLHSEIMYNYNALLFNPLYLIVLYFILSHKHKAAIVSLYVCLALVGLYTAILITKPYLLTVLPIIMLTAILLVRILMHTKKKVA